LLVGVAVAFDLVHTVGEFAASTAPVVAKVYAAMISVSGWVAAVVAAWQLRRGRLQAGRILLLLAGTFLVFAGALPDVTALASSQLASTLDPALSRATIALTLGLGLGMVAASLLDQRAARQPLNRAGRPHSMHRTSGRVSGECAGCLTEHRMSWCSWLAGAGDGW
jgi:hypothetical protein